MIQKIKVIYFLYILIIFIGSSTRFTESDYLIFGTFVFSFAFFYYLNKSFDFVILIPLLIYNLCSFFSVIYFGEELSLMALGGYNIRILTAYFIIKTFEYNFFILYRKYVYYLALISVPLYFVQYFNINYFNSNFSFLNMSGELRSQADRWNFFIYTAQLSTTFGLPRNSGFGIEPGHFGFILGIAVLIDVIEKNFTISKQTLIMILIACTTFSTAFFIFLGLLILLISVNRNYKINLSSFIFLLFYPIIIYLLLSSNIVTDKIDNTYLTQQMFKQYRYNIDYDGSVLDRFSMVDIGIQNFLAFPIGHGMNYAGLVRNSSGNILMGPNTLMWMLIEWGIIFIIFYPILLMRFFKLYYPKINPLSQIIILIMISTWLFSTSIQTRDIVFFIMIIIGLINPGKSRFYTMTKIMKH